MRAAAAPSAGTFARRLLTWFARAGRHDLPWQRERTLYRVWVSEIMLQQTQVATVIPYFERFIARFPDVATLAAAPLDEVLHLWSGLGYYARARNLHRAAQWVRDRNRGEVPDNVATLVELPGIGRSTAAAILALACDVRHPILDGNVKRVLARWFGVAGFLSSPKVVSELWSLSLAVTPARHAAAYTQAIMDLGATVCRLRKPDCERCPVRAGCVACASGRTAELPATRPARVRPQRRVVWLVLRAGNAVLLARRPPRGVWGGLWGFPEFTARRLATGAVRRRTGTDPVRLERLGPIRHAFTHFELEIEPLLCELDADEAWALPAAGETWYNLRDPPRVGLAAPVSALMERLATTVAPSRRR